MPDSDAELLEVLLSKVMRLAAMHDDTPIEVAGTTLYPAEAALLVELASLDEVTQQQVADRLRLDKSRVSRLCSGLERKHLLVRQRDESNRRNLCLRITEAGTETAARLRRAWREQHEGMLAAMTAQERRALLLGLGALARELAALHPEHHGVPHSPADRTRTIR